MGPPDSSKCQEDLDIMCHTCGELGLPLAEEKQVGPSTQLVFLGIELDTVHMEIRLPAEKLLQVTELVASWRGRKSCRMREFQSLVGSLQHACKVVSPGRSFVRRMHELLKRGNKGSDHLRLNREFRADMEWWHRFLSEWNGVSMFRKVRAESPEAEFWSDASGSWGCGAYWSSQWLQWQWIPGSALDSASIAAKEFLPILLASIVWGEAWCGCTIRCNCDNEAVVHVINGRYARDPLLAHMLRCLFFICARQQFTLVAKHTPEKDNVAADAISRNNFSFAGALCCELTDTNSTISNKDTGLQLSRLVVARLDQLVQFYFKQTLAPSTMRSYESAKKNYLAFCVMVQANPVSVTETVLLRFVAALAADGLTSSTIKCYLSGVRHLQLSCGLGDPKVGDMATLQHILRSIKSSQAKSSARPRTRLPITPAILSRLHQVWERDQHDHNSIMLWAACTRLAFWLSQIGGDYHTNHTYL